MSPSLPADVCDVPTPPNDTHFEGAEKKLNVVFAPDYSSPCYQHFGLRALSRQQIDTITDAAKCNILSVISNGVTDAYLLSESSLFVSQTNLMIKTCGTTTLLHALPTVIRLAASVGLFPVRLSFTRVAYLLPQKQPYPHNSFDSEVSFLNGVLQCCESQFRYTTWSDSQWFAYVAAFQQNIFTTIPQAPLHSQHTLEICMFDLDPRVMRRFMFHMEPSRIGTDLLTGGTTERSGISKLLRDANVVDAFNFDPCGYSMNAVAPCGGYYTIHVTPEDEGSYVSFEATVNESVAAHVVAAVVRTFQPGRLTVAVTLNEISHTGYDLEDRVANDRERQSFSWNALSKLLCPDFIRDGQLNKGHFHSWDSVMSSTFASYHACDASAWYSRDTADETDLEIQVSDLHPIDGALVVGAYVAKEVGAIAVSRFGTDEKLDLARIVHCVENWQQETIPAVIVDIGRVARNCETLCAFAAGDFARFRFAVNCFADESVLRVLAQIPEVTFEVADVTEIDTLSRVGVSRERIVLMMKVLTREIATLFSRVGGIVMHDIPEEGLALAIRQAQLRVEVVLVETDLNRAADLVVAIGKECGDVRSIGFECGVGSTESASTVCSMVRETSNGFWPVVKARVEGPKDGAWNMGSIIEIASIIDVSEMVVAQAVSVILRVTGRRMRNVKHGHVVPNSVCDVYLNDGMYGLLGSCGMRGVPKYGGVKTSPRLLPTDTTNQRRICSATFWGPTCDSLDRVWDGSFEELMVGDHVVFDDVGAFALSCVSSFNGFCRNYETIYVTSEE